MKLPRRPALGALALALFVGLAAPAGADQTFWSLKTGATPKPLPTNSAGVTVDYIYYPCLDTGSTTSCSCGTYGRPSGYLERDRGCYDADDRYRHAPRAYPFTRQRTPHLTIPPAPAPLPT